MGQPVGGVSRRHFLHRTLVLGGAGGLLAACGPQAPATAPPATSAPAAKAAPAATTAPAASATQPAAVAQPAKPKAGGSYTHGSVQEPDRFWSPFSGLVVSYEIAHITNGTLIKINEKLEYVPGLAQEVPTLENGGISADGLTYTFKLRPDVKWSDGQPFTSADLRFTYDVLTMQGTDVRGRAGWDQMDTVETPNDTTVVYKFKNVVASFLDLAANVHILPKHILGGLAAADINKHTWFRAPTAGLGPYVFKEWVPGSHLTFTKNSNYYKPGQPYIDTIVYKIVPDANSLLNQLQNGEIDSRVRLSNEHVDVVKGFNNATLVSEPSATPWLLWMNNTKFPFDDRNVRIALAHGFDKTGIANQLLKGHVQPAWQLISPLSWAHNPQVVKYAYDPAKARQVLDEGGWALESDGVRAKGGRKLTFEIMNIAGEQERLQILSFVQRQWKEIGVDARVRNVDVGTLFGQALPQRTFEMAYSFSSRYADPEMSTLFLSPELKPPGNYAGYANPELDKILLESGRTVDRAKRKELLFQAQDIVARDAVNHFLAWLTNHTALNKRVQGYKPAPGYTEFWNVDEWSVTS